MSRFCRVLLFRLCIQTKFLWIALEFSKKEDFSWCSLRSLVGVINVTTMANCNCTFQKLKTKCRQGTWNEQVGKWLLEPTLQGDQKPMD